MPDDPPVATICDVLSHRPEMEAPVTTKTARTGDQILAGIAVILVAGVGGYLGYIFFGSITW
jgi:hypothetical protein